MLRILAIDYYEYLRHSQRPHNACVDVGNITLNVEFRKIQTPLDNADNLVCANSCKFHTVGTETKINSLKMLKLKLKVLSHSNI
jgi:hypothetical protein